MNLNLEWYTLTEVPNESAKLATFAETLRPLRLK
jgi:hypothetical protein